MAEHGKHRKPRNLPHPETTDPNSMRSKHTISTLLLSSSPTNETAITVKKKNFPTAASFRGLGCTASSQVSVPAAIRTSANWEAKKLKKKRIKTKKIGHGGYSCNSVADVTNNGNPLLQPSVSLSFSSSCVSVPNDVWCGPGIGLTTDAASVDCVVTRRPGSRGKLDGRTTYAPRRMVTHEDIPFPETDTSSEISRFHDDMFASRHHRHVRHGFREGLAEIVMLQNSMSTTGARSHDRDRYWDTMRLDVDHMSYEELLALGERIGYVSTGLRDDVVARCLRRSKITLSDLSSRCAKEIERKCSICQEEYEKGDETGKLSCEHFYHIDCIKKWLEHKKICPICKTEAVPQT